MPKKFYWLRLHRDFFKRHDVKIIESMPNGKDYVLFLLKLMAESIDHEGRLRFSDTIPYSAAMLSTITGTNIDIVRSAIKLFEELGLMTILDDETLYISIVENMIGSRSESADRMQRHRARKKALEASRVTKSDVTSISSSISDSKKEENKICDGVIDYLNAQTGKRFRHNDTNRRLVAARMHDGFTEDDCRLVIANKVADWLDDEKMNEYLRPVTLFAPTKFEGYLNRKKEPKPETPMYTPGENLDS